MAEDLNASSDWLLTATKMPLAESPATQKPKIPGFPELLWNSGERFDPVCDLWPLE
jgi:hypothetical protein